MELFTAHTGLKLVHVSYPGAAAAATDVIAGQAPLMFDNIFTTLPIARSGKFRALAVSTVQRSAVAPELPTVAESGVPGYDANAWFGLLKRLPKPCAACFAVPRKSPAQGRAEATSAGVGRP